MATESLTSSYIATNGQINAGVVKLANIATEAGNANKTFTWDGSGVPTASATTPGETWISTTTFAGDTTKTISLPGGYELYKLKIKLVNSTNAAIKVAPQNPSSNAQWTIVDAGSLSRINAGNAYFQILPGNAGFPNHCAGDIIFNITKNANGVCQFAGVVANDGSTGQGLFLGAEMGTSDATITSIIFSVASGNMTGKVQLCAVYGS